MTVQIAPSILAADFTRLGDEVREAAAAGADRLHIDVMDGRFVPNISMGPFIVEAVRELTELMLEVHLMIVEPENYIPAFAQAGADLIMVHVETCPHLHRTVEQIKELDKKAGVVLNPATSIESLKEIITYVDLVLVMTVNPGFGGQNFIRSMPDKIQRVRGLINSYQPDCDLEVDGGIAAATVPLAVESGANVLVAGTAVFRHPQGIAAGITALRQKLDLASD